MHHAHWIPPALSPPTGARTATSQRWMGLIQLAGPGLARSAWLAGLLVLVTLAASAATLGMEPDIRRDFLSENGPVERASAGLFGLITVGLLTISLVQRFWSLPRQPRHAALLASLVACFWARELDFHTRFTHGSVLKTSFLLRDDLSWMTKLSALAVVGMIIAIVLAVGCLHAKAWLGGLRAKRWQSILPVSACLLVVFSKGLDAGLGSLKRMGVDLPPTPGAILASAEEISELFIPCLIAAMLVNTLIKLRTIPRCERTAADHQATIQTNPITSR